MITVWVSCRERNLYRLQGEITAYLAYADIEARPLHPESPAGPGIVIYADVTPELCDFLRGISRNGRERVLCISAPGAASPGGVWNILESGASDVLDWDRPEARSKEITLRLKRWKEIDEILESPLIADNLVGKSREMRTALRHLIEVARFTDAPVLITGESGTGKEVAARLIHDLSRNDGKRRFVVLDCTTIVPTLAGSEFFGHEKGAFTGANMSRDGAFALADGGTLFLDEVSELPPELQAQLLRVVQEKSFKRVGGNSWQRSEFRLVCATNRDLQEEVRQGRFRNDLYYRIAGWELRLPPLRDRSDDILLLARHFMRQIVPYESPPELDKAVEDFLLKRGYPGNVRDLKQLVNRIMHCHVGKGPVTVGDIPPRERPTMVAACAHWRDETFEMSIRKAILMGYGLKEIGKAAEDTAVDIAVEAENGNLQRAARRLGVTDRSLQLRRASRRQNGLSA